MINLVRANTDYAAVMVEAISESLSDLQPWMPWATPDYSMATAEHWITEIASQGYEFFIIGPEGNYLGNVGVNTIRTDNQIGNLGYWIRSSQQGRGYATRAVRKLVPWIRENTDLNRLEIVAAVGNQASCRVATKSGAFYEGVAKARLLLHGEFHDAAMFSFTVGGPGA